MVKTNNVSKNKAPSVNSVSSPRVIPAVGLVTLDGDFLKTNQGARISDSHISLKVGVRGPALLEVFELREKITSFDHKRIPERVHHLWGASLTSKVIPA